MTRYWIKSCYPSRSLAPLMTGPLHHAMQPPAMRQRGMALGLILVAVALMVGIGIAIMTTNYINLGDYHDPSASTAGATVLDQARNLRMGIEAMTNRGIPISAITFDTSGTSGLFNPSNGGIETQPPLTYPTYIRDTNSPTNWVWKVDGSGNPVVKINGLGIDANPDYVLIMPDLSYEACKGVNQLLFNYPPPPTITGPATFSAWTTPSAAIDLSASGATGGRTEGCFIYVDENGVTRYVFISPVRAE